MRSPGFRANGAHSSIAQVPLRHRPVPCASEEYAMTRSDLGAPSDSLRLRRNGLDIAIWRLRPTAFMHGNRTPSCQPDVLTTPKFRAFHRYAGGKCGPQLRVVRFAPQQSVTVRRQARPKTVFPRKMS